MTAEQTTEAAETGSEETAAPITLPDDHPLVRTLAEQKKAIKELKAKAQRLDEIEEANKTEAQRTTERLAEAEKAAAEARAEALRLRIATKHGISDEDADLFLTGTDEATLTRQAERLAGREADRKKQGGHVPREGTPPTPPQEDEMRKFARNLFDRAQS